MGYINSKKYGSAVQHYAKANGDISYYITYKDEFNKLKRIKVGDKSKGITEPYCNQMRNDIIHKVRLGEDIGIKHKKKNKIRLNEMAEIYFDEKRASEKRKSVYNVHIKPLFGDRDPENITKDEIKKLINTLLDDNKAAQTVNNIFGLIRTIYNYHIKEKELKILNPCAGIKKLKTDNNRERYLQISEINTLYSEIKHSITLTNFVQLSLQTGGRLETILHIKKKDIDLQNETITLVNLKTGETYKGFLQSSYVEYLKKYLQNLKLNDYVVSFDKNKKVTSRQIQSRLKPILDKLFNKELQINDRKNRTVIHTFRHTFASHLAINGTPIFTIKELMNHSDIEQTMRYAKLDPLSGKDMVQKLYINGE